MSRRASAPARLGVVLWTWIQHDRTALLRYLVFLLSIAACATASGSAGRGSVLARSPGGQDTAGKTGGGLAGGQRGAAASVKEAGAAGRCLSALRYLLKRGANLKQLLTEQAGQAIACADQEPDLRPEALAAVLHSLGADTVAPMEWITAARRWARGPAPDPIVVHFLA